jgi:hypothetical protein
MKRRKFISTAITSAGVFSFLPSSDLLAGRQRKLLWAGINFMQAAGDKKLTSIDKYFPNTYPILQDPTKAAFLYNKLPGKWGAPVGRSKDYQLVWANSDNNIDIAKDTDLGIMLGISSDRDIAHRYYKKVNKDFLVYELQTYLTIFDIEKFEIIQSYPIRIWSYEAIVGRKSTDSLQKLMWQTLGGGSAPKGTITIPTILQQKLQEIDFKTQKTVNLRVTAVKSRKMTQDWVTGQRQKITDFEGILGNAMTTAVSEEFNIGIQPYAPGKALTQLTLTFMGASGERRDSSLVNKILNTGPIDLEIRLLSRGIKINKTYEPGSKTVFTNRVSMMVEIQVGRWERTYHGDQKLVVKDEKLKELIFKQKLTALSREKTTGVYSNDWYWILDLHKRLFDWFFRELKKGNSYPKMSSGQRDRFEAREFVIRVFTDDYPKFESEARALRAALVTQPG